MQPEPLDGLEHPGPGRIFGRICAWRNGVIGSLSLWQPASDGEWRGYHDQVLVYDVPEDAWSVLDRPMPYGMNTLQATLVDDMIYVTGGEPATSFNFNTEDVVMIGSIRMLAD